MSQTKAQNPVPLTTTGPAPEEERNKEIDAGHQHSHAAHLKGTEEKPHTKPAGNLRQGSYPSGRRQP